MGSEERRGQIDRREIIELMNWRHQEIKFCRRKIQGWDSFMSE